VILLAVIAVLMAEPLQQVNALKNVLQGVDNMASALMFVVIAQVDFGSWARCSPAGRSPGPGRRTGRKTLAPVALRAFIVVIGVAGSNSSAESIGRTPCLDGAREGVLEMTFLNTVHREALCARVLLLAKSSHARPSSRPR
jgi:hypothetical protein